jgi:hypothetical protein
VSVALRVESVNEQQIAVGLRLGLDLRGRSVRVASAMIGDFLMTHFWGVSERGQPSLRQRELAEEFGFDISGLSKGVGSAVIDDIMDHLNKEAIETEGLEPGVQVRFRSRDDGRVRIVSSVTPDGTVYFKGGNGQKAWARSLVRVR